MDDFHAQARPDYFVYREKVEIYPKDAFIHNLAYPGGLELGAFDGEQIVGVVGATIGEESGMINGVKTVCLDNIYVLPAYRRRGIAAKIFAEVEAWAKEQGTVRLDVYTWNFNKGAIAMYDTMGWHPNAMCLKRSCNLDMMKKGGKVECPSIK